MKFIGNPDIFRPLAERAIRLYGYAPEHNLEWFFNVTDPNQKPIFALWPDGAGVLAHAEPKAWHAFAEPLAPASQKGKRLIEFADYVLDQPGVEKVVLDLQTQTRKDVLELLPPGLRAVSVNYTDVWPVMNMEKFDPTLAGGHFKSIRNAKSKFYREHRVNMVEAKDVDKGDLKDMVDVWKKIRGGGDRPYYHRYYNLIESGFSACKSARAMLVDGRAAGFNGGWEIPNSGRQWYAAIGIHDYSVRDLGLMLYLEDLIWIKNAGYKVADMGGGEKALTDFKNQFLPERWYKTYEFSVVRQ